MTIAAPEFFRQGTRPASFAFVGKSHLSPGFGFHLSDGFIDGGDMLRLKVRIGNYDEPRPLFV